MNGIPLSETIAWTIVPSAPAQLYARESRAYHSLLLLGGFSGTVSTMA